MIADEKKVVTVAEWPVPKTVKKLQQFLGLANYYNRFIHNFAEIAVPLTALLQKSSEQSWGSPQQNAFDALKQALCNPPVLQLPNLEHNFVEETDASKFAISGTLMQDIGKGLKPVQYLSRKSNSTELRYPTQDRELLAIRLSFKYFRSYFEQGLNVRINSHSEYYSQLVRLRTGPYVG